MKHISEIPTPAVLIEASVLERNLQATQERCKNAGVELWPHCKTHKLIPILRRQLELGANGATCAKVGEAEALLPSGVRRVFIAHSLVSPLVGGRLRKLADHLDELIVAVTSLEHFDALEALLRHESLDLPVLMAVDTGLNREGVRSIEDGQKLAGRIRNSARMHFKGIYTHEGHAYLAGTTPEAIQGVVASALEQLQSYQEAIGGDVPLWPGCSVTAAAFAATGAVHAVRPGAYVFGDLFLSRVAPVMRHEDLAATVLATVVDRPAPGMALIDAGSKTFSSDKTPEGIAAACLDDPALSVTRLSEEHGFVHGENVSALRIGSRMRFVPAHVCPVINLAREVFLVDGERVLNRWPVDARGCVS